MESGLVLFPNDLLCGRKKKTDQVKWRESSEHLNCIANRTALNLFLCGVASNWHFIFKHTEKR